MLLYTGPLFTVHTHLLCSSLICMLSPVFTSLSACYNYLYIIQHYLMSSSYLIVNITHTHTHTRTHTQAHAHTYIHTHAPAHGTITFGGLASCISDGKNYGPNKLTAWIAYILCERPDTTRPRKNREVTVLWIIKLLPFIDFYFYKVGPM